MKNNAFLSIIIPVKNEQENIAWTIEKIGRTVLVNHEILIIYDSPQDLTLPIVKKLQGKKKNLRLIRNKESDGVLYAVKTGIDKAHGDILVVMAADRTDDPRTINTMYKKILEGYDIVCPTRYSKGGKVIGPTSIKSLLSKLSGVSTPYLLGIPTSDLTYSFKMFRKKILDTIEIQSVGGFEFAEELLIKSHFTGARIIEVPTIWVDRKYGQSKFKLAAWLPSYIYWYVWGIIMRIRSLLMPSHI